MSTFIGVVLSLLILLLIDRRAVFARMIGRTAGVVVAGVAIAVPPLRRWLGRRWLS